MARRISILERIPLAPVIGAMFGTAAAILIAATPGWMFGAAVALLGLSTLGLMARPTAIVVAFAGVAGIVWAFVRIAEFIFAGPATPVADADADDVVDANLSYGVTNSAAPPRPIFADRELGAPFMSDEALMTLAKRDAVAKQEQAETEAEAEAEAEASVDQPVEQDAVSSEALVATPVQSPDEASIEALIRRLEAGIARRDPPRPPSPTGPAVALPQSRSAPSWFVRRDDFNDDGSATRLQRAVAG